ncbi:MAG TPA: hypothetical protein VGL81_09145 [Polyangiaceae bacterium]
MTIQLIPCWSEPSYFEMVTLEGTTYGLQFDYNQRCASWYMHVADSAGVDIYNGVKLVTGFSLLKKCKDPRAPAGAIIVVAAGTDQTPPQQYDLLPNARCTLQYITSDWVQLFVTGQGQTVLDLLNANAQASALSPYGQG